MTLGLALSSALSGLSLNQKALSVASNNITNANTEGYTRKINSPNAQVTAGLGTGATSQLRRVVDEFLSQAMRGEAATTGKVNAVKDYMDRIQSFLGSPENGRTIMSSLDDFFSAMSNLAASPEQSFFRSQAVQKTVDLANTISGMADQLQKTRLQADKDIVESVSNINRSLDALYSINNALREAGYSAGNQEELLDQRDTELQKLMQHIDVGVAFRPTGEVIVFNQKTELLSTNRYHLTYTPAGSVSVFTEDQDLGKIQVVVLDANGDETDDTVDLSTEGKSSEVTTDILDGKIRGLMNLRDVEIPRVLEQLDALANGLRETANTIHNDGIGFPPPHDLTGVTEVYNSKALDIDGTMMIAVLNADGTPIASPYNDAEGLKRPLTLDFSKIYGANGWGAPTVGEIITEINQYYDSSQPRTVFGALKDVQLVPMSDNTTGPFAFDLEFENAGDQPLNITIVSVNGVAEGDAFTAPAGSMSRTGPTYSYSIAGAGPYNIPVVISFTDPTTGFAYTDTINYTVPATASGLRSDRVSASTLTGGATPPFRGNMETPTTNARIAQAMLVDASGATISPNNATARGFLKLTASSTAGTVAIDQMTSEEATTGRGFSHYFGMNNLFVENDSSVIGQAASNLSVRSTIVSDPRLFTTGKLARSSQPSGTGAAPLYTYDLSVGSSQIATRMADLQNGAISFAAAGTLPAYTNTLGAYSSEIYSYLGGLSNSAAGAVRQQELLNTTYSDKLNGISGVNIDEELANTVLYQNAYSASARIITVVTTLFDVLLQIKV